MSQASSLQGNGPFGPQLERLLRTKWTDVNTAMQEVYAVLSTLRLPTPTPAAAATASKKAVSGAGAGAATPAASLVTAPCQIIAPIGTFTPTPWGFGQMYQCNLYPDGIFAPPTPTNVFQLSISNDVIPAGTPAIAVLCTDGQWYMQVPVWM